MLAGCGWGEKSWGAGQTWVARMATLDDPTYRRQGEVQGTDSGQQGEDVLFFPHIYTCFHKTKDSVTLACDLLFATW